VKKMWCYQRKDTAVTMVARPAGSDPGGQEWPKRRKPTREGWIPGTGADVVTEEGHGQIASLPWPTHHKRKRRVTRDDRVVEGEKNEEVSSGTVVIRVRQVVCLQNG